MRETKVSAYKFLLDVKKFKRNAYWYKDVSHSFDEFILDVDKTASYLDSKGIKAGDCVLLCLPNLPSTIIAFYAINKIGAIANIVHPLVPVEALKEIILKTNTKALFILDSIKDEIEDFINEQNIFAITSNVKDSLMDRDIIYENEKIVSFKSAKCCKNLDKKYYCDSKAPAIYLHSGGTSGDSKTIVLSSFAINELAKKTSKVLIVDGDYLLENDNGLMRLPIFHGFGLGVSMHTILSYGGSVTIIPKFDVVATTKDMMLSKTNIMFGVPSMFERLFANDIFRKEVLKNITQIYCGGDNLNKNLLKQFNETLLKFSNCEAVLEGYGLSELASVTSTNTYKNRKFGSLGKPLEENEYIIVDSNLNKLKANEKGELLISTSSIMNCYFNDEKATNDTIIELDGKKWLKTGDICYLDEEGYMFFIDRAKRMIKIAGNNVYPGEIEKLLKEEIYIKEVIAIDRKNKKNKSYIRLYVVLLEDIKESKKELANKIREIISKNLIKYYFPREIIFIEQMPLTKIGKIDYIKLKGENDTFIVY